MPSNAAIYFADNSLLGTKFFSRYSQIESYEGLSDGDSASGLRLTIPGANITMNFMPPEKIPSHLNGFMGYAQSAHEGSEDDQMYVLARISQARHVLGCVIEPGFDEAGTVADFLVNFTAGLNGLLFIWDSIVDYDGVALLGPLLQQSDE
jgi:hypothetical protein